MSDLEKPSIGPTARKLNDLQAETRECNFAMLDLNEVNPEEIDALLEKAQEFPSVGERAAFISNYFRGKQVDFRKGGTPSAEETREKLKINFEAVNCVTFVYYTMALAHSRNFTEFTRILRELNYRNGELEASNKIHYSTEYADKGVEQGYFEDVTASLGASVEHRALHAPSIDDQPEMDLETSYIPSAKVESILGNLQNGDLIFFIGEWDKTLVRHCAMMYRTESGALRVRMASSSESRKDDCIVDTSLTRYLAHFTKFIGIRVLRPTEQTS